MIAELDVPNSGAARVHRTYAWGLDASGTLTGAGGVGGLLLTSHHTPQAGGGTQVTTLAPLYDFNGNVLAYADVATSTITHRMEYDPFGQELSLDTLLPGESAAEAPRFRFSTKYTDGETGLVYYGYRSYSPELGRWVNRDPIGERGGINLYGMVGNDAVNVVDKLGRDAVHIGSGWYIFIMRSDLSFDSLKGGRITHENENWSCECATGAQWLSGTQKSDGVHDAPSTSTWRKGAPVSISTAPGTMIATGWVGDRYLSESVSQALQSGRNVVNHVGIFRGFDERGNILLFDQWDPANNGNTIDSEDGVLDTRDWPAAQGWFVVKSKFECDAKPTGATPRPAQLD
jgi:RHS repeat-associated protein